MVSYLHGFEAYDAEEKMIWDRQNILLTRAFISMGIFEAVSALVMFLGIGYQ